MRKSCFGCLTILVAIAAGVVYLLIQWNDAVGIATDFEKSPMRREPPPALAAPVTLKVVTFNIQALWIVGERRPQRMRAIAAKLLILDPDVVGIQEAFVPENRELLIDDLTAHTRLQHVQYYPSARVGSGLLILSAFPMREVYFQRYSGSGPWWKIWEGDFWAGKGAALARIELPDGAGYFDLFNTHAQAGYGNPAYAALRKGQFAELAAFVKGARMGTVPAFVVGDLNARPGGSGGYDELIAEAGLVRLMNVESGVDHILAVNDSGYRFEVLETVPIEEQFTYEGQVLPLSDHVGYLSTIAVTPVRAQSESGG